jgi:hypothetical protein
MDVIRRGAFLVAVLSTWMAVGACRRAPDTATSGSPTVAGDQQELAALDAKRRQRAEVLRGMNVAKLAEQMAADAKRGAEPFNSSAYRELVSRGEAAAAELKAALTPDPTSVLALLALRRISAEQYRNLDATVRASILVGALQQAKFFNAWGIPHLFWEDAARAVIEEGRAIETPLSALLDDKREGAIWGSEGAVEQRRYRYRVCDYAWAMLNEIRGQKVEIPADPAARDPLIEAAKKAPGPK